jgi:uncharacterized protein involved in exopolysaccharide biosynthesis
VRKLLHLAALLYPATWRRRYGAEFAALLEDSTPQWRDLFDILNGAIIMQLSQWSARNVTIAGGLAGLILAAALAFSLPNLYVSRAVMRITPSQIPENQTPAAYNRQAAENIRELWLGVMTRASLSELIQRPGLDLYKTDRQHKPLEDVIEQMKSQDIKIEILGMDPGKHGIDARETRPASAFVLSFSYPDRFIAQQVISALITKLVDANQVAARAKATTNARTNTAVSLDLLDPASLPQSPVAPNRKQIVLVGLVLGLLAGILAVGARRWPLVALSGLAGLILAAGWAFSLPNLYVSRAMMRITPSQIPESQTPASFNQQAADHIRELWQGLMTRSSLAELIQRPNLDLYKSDRQHKPLEDVIEQMRSKDIKLDFLGTDPLNPGPASVFVLSFNYPDRFVAQRVISALVAELTDANQVAARSQTRTSTAVSLDLLDPASLPQTPTAPNRSQIVLIGLALGLVAGLLALGARRWPLVALSGLAGCLIAGAVSYLLPNTYISGAALRANVPGLMPGLWTKVVTDDFLTQVIEKERLSGTVNKLRSHLRIEAMNSFNSPSTAFFITFSDSDRYKAHGVVVDIANALFLAANQSDPSASPGRPLEFLDRPSVPELPAAPNRSEIAGIGLALGLLATSIATWIRTRRTRLATRQV